MLWQIKKMEFCMCEKNCNFANTREARLQQGS